MTKTCTFFGHKDTPETVKNGLHTTIEKLITEYGVETFYVGNQGAFDFHTRAALRQLQEKYPYIRYAVVLAYMPGEVSEYEDHSDTMVPEGIEAVHPKYAIDWRNRWMLRESQYIICYMLEDKATWAVDQWIAAIDSAVIREMQAAQAQLDKEKEEKLFGGNDDLWEDLPSSHDDGPAPTAVDFADKSDQVDYYTNVRLDKIQGKIYIPCGVGNTDNGFYICGISEKHCSEAPTVFALVYNYLVRNSCITPEDYPHYLNTVATTFQINYQRVFRLMMIILQLIKNGMVGRKLDFTHAFLTNIPNIKQAVFCC